MLPCLPGSSRRLSASLPHLRVLPDDIAPDLVQRSFAQHNLCSLYNGGEEPVGGVLAHVNMANTWPHAPEGWGASWREGRRAGDDNESRSSASQHGARGRSFEGTSRQISHLYVRLTRNSSHEQGGNVGT